MRWIALQACTTEPGAPLPDLALVQDQLASLALAFTPRVALLDEAVVMDVTASLRLFGGLQRLLQLLRQRLTEFFESIPAPAQVKHACGATS